MVSIIYVKNGEHKLWTREGPVFRAHKVETGTSNGVVTEIISGVSVGTDVLTEFSISNGETNEEENQANPFMPRPKNRNQNQNKK